MPRRARKPNLREAEQRLVRNRYLISEARRALVLSPLRTLMESVRLQECDDVEGDPETAAVDPAAGVIWVNPHRRPRGGAEGGETDWTVILAHMLLHLGLNHAARREDREPLVWNAACDHAADQLLAFFRLAPKKPASLQVYASDEREEDAYERLMDERAVAGSKKPDLWTFAGRNRPDILGLTRPQPWHGAYEERLAEGIRLAVESTVRQVARALGDEDLALSAWAPAERARRWVQNELPLLGALCTQIRIIADAQLCQRLDISIAAVDGYLGEMYFNPSWNFTQEELIFIYVHELLHVALAHHTRSRGRDPWVWNVATDFVINGWLVEMGVGKLPPTGGLFDPRLQGMSADEVYDLLQRDPKRCKGLRGFRGKLGDVLVDGPRRIYRDDVTTLDGIYRRCLQSGLSLCSRGTVPAGLLEEIRALFSPPPPWDVALGRWMEGHVPLIRESLRSYARASRRQASTPDIPRPARYVPHEWREACTFGVVLDTSGSMDRDLLGRALGTIASYSEARDVPRVRLVLCDASPYDQGFVAPADLRGIYPIKGRGGTVLQPAISHLVGRPDFPQTAPVMVVTDGWCEEELVCPREHCFVLPRKSWKEGAMLLRTSAPVFRVLREEHYES